MTSLPARVGSYDPKDEFLKCKSQTLAEQAAGEVYFFIPAGATPATNSAVSLRVSRNSRLHTY